MPTDQAATYGSAGPGLMNASFVPAASLGTEYTLPQFHGLLAALTSAAVNAAPVLADVEDVCVESLLSSPPHAATPSASANDRAAAKPPRGTRLIALLLLHS